MRKVFQLDIADSQSPQPTYRTQHVSAWIYVLLLCLLGTVACQSTANTPTTQPVGARALPTPRLSLETAPTDLCQVVTQIKLYPRVRGILPDEVTATWTLTANDTPTSLASDTWNPEDNEVLVKFPDGKPLPPGTYQVYLTLGEVINTHTFIITNAKPQITHLALALTPNGPDSPTLSTPTRSLYLRYAFKGACPGAPLWASVTWNGQTLCKQNLTLNTMAGQDVIACYREDGAPFEPGQYNVVLTLMNEATRELAFTFAPPTPTPAPPTPTPTPTPTRSPTPRPLACEPLFTASALSPEGEPLLTKTEFEWYSLAAFVGARCQNLQPGTPWNAQWFRNGEEVRTHSGTWQGAADGVVWDSFAETPPFLSYGVYTVTLRVGGLEPQATTFRVIPYEGR